MEAQVSKTMQDFVRINVQPGIMQKVPELREAFGSNFRQFYRVWEVSRAHQCTYHCMQQPILAHFNASVQQMTKDINTRALIAATGKTRKQAARRLNDLQSRIMEALWPKVDQPPSPSTPERGPSTTYTNRAGGNNRTQPTGLSESTKEIAALNEVVRDTVRTRQCNMHIYFS